MKKYIFFIILFFSLPAYAGNNISLSSFHTASINKEWINSIGIFRKHYKVAANYDIECTKNYCRSNSKKHFFYLKLKGDQNKKYKFKSFKIKYIIINLQKFSKVYRGSGYKWSINNSISVSALRKNKDTVYEKHYISIGGTGIKNMSRFFNYFVTNRFAIKYNNLNYKCVNNVCRWKINGSLDISQAH
jgi:hypothetical protein